MMKIIRTYEVRVTGPIGEGDLKNAGLAEYIGSMYDTMTRLLDIGDQDSIYLYKDAEGELAWGRWNDVAWDEESKVIGPVDWEGSEEEINWER